MSIENESSLEPDSVKKVIGFLLLAIALVILPSQLTSKRVEAKTPNVQITLGQLEPTANAASLQDLIATPEVVSEPVVEPSPEPVVAEVIPTPPPVVQEPVEPPVAPEPVVAGTGSCEAEIAKYDWNQTTALAVARAESGLNPGALNNNPRTKDYSVGCFQINLYGANAKSRPSEATLKQASHNVAFAYKIYKSNGSSFKGQWGVCRKISCY